MIKYILITLKVNIKQQMSNETYTPLAPSVEKGF